MGGCYLIDNRNMDNGRRRSSAAPTTADGGAHKRPLLDMAMEGFYVNVFNPDAFLIRVAYSKASILFICVIGLLTAFNCLTFTSQLSEANLLCSFNDHLPLGKELRRIVMPVVYGCRLLEMSVPVQVLQLVFCIAALVCALNRRSTLFILFYTLICLAIFLSAVFLIILLLIDYQKYIRPSVHAMLQWVITKDPSFCGVLEPMLDCRILMGNRIVTSTPPTTTTTTPFPVFREGEVVMVEGAAERPRDTNDAIEATCGYRSRNLKLSPGVECTDHLSSFLMHRNWMLGLVVEYALLLLAGVAVTLYAIMKRGQRPSTASELRDLENVKVVVVEGSDS